MIIRKTRDVRTPSRGTQFSAGIDFYVPYDQPQMFLEPSQSVLIPSGIKCDVPDNYALIAFNKSGIATKKQLIAGACVVDSDYTGEIHLHLINLSKTTVLIEPGEKILQFILIPVFLDEIVEDNDYIAKTTLRGEQGFGSTG
jgi:dUTP pyrophosphatase